MSTNTDAFVGLWQGTIRASGQEIRLVFHIERSDPSRPEQGLKATVDSPDQGVNGIPVESVTVSDTRITLKVTATQGSYSGTLSEGVIVGHWDQAGSSFSVDLSRIEKVEKIRRPQDPEPPFPYRAEEVSFSSGGNVTLAGTLTVPDGPGPFPAAVLVTGSGPQNRDEEIFNHRPFLVLADHLSRRGVAVLRYDDRGVGGSTGDGQTATQRDLAGDTAAAVQFLESRPEIMPGRIGVIGHSEGAMIAPLVAEANPDLAYLVLLAGPGCSGYDILLQQTAALLRAGGAPEAQIRNAQDINRSLYDVVRSEPDNTRAADRLRTMTRSLGVPEDQIEIQIAAMLTPWYRSFLRFDPANALRATKCPVLALTGSLDRQVPPDENLAAIADAVRSGGNDRVETHRLEGLNHLFQHAATGLPEEYARIDETFAPEALDRIAGWVRSVTAR